MAELTKWIVNDNSGHGCEDITILDTMEDANALAAKLWDELPAKAKEYTIISVHYITESMLEDSANKNGEINWYLYKNYDQTPECFDSKVFKTLR